LSGSVVAAAGGHDFVVATHHICGGGIVFMPRGFVVALSTRVLVVFSESMSPTATAEGSSGRGRSGADGRRWSNGGGVGAGWGHDDCAVGAVTSRCLGG
jgi:hypothetical protein